MGKTRVSDGDRTRDNWSHNPRGTEESREVTHAERSQKTGENRTDSAVPGPGPDSDWYRRAADWLIGRVVGRAEAVEVGVPRRSGRG